MELFEGNRALFDGLAADTRWDWTQRYPVIRISFSDGVLHSRAELDRRIAEILRLNRETLGVPLSAEIHADDLTSNFADLIRQTRHHHGARAVVLIDEHDKPILDNITDPDTARVMRDGLNNLTDLTIDPAYSALCGYTDQDVDTVFAPELHGLDRDEIRRWYNGYNWLGTSVYNPFDLLLLFRNRSFQPYWFETGTPTFLVELLSQRQQFTPDLGRLHAAESLLSTFDVDYIASEALLFQAGYLTIDTSRTIPGRREFTLKYPNLEVQASLNDSLLQQLCGRPDIPGRQISRLYDLLVARDVAGLEPLFHAFFATIQHDWYRSNDIARFEGYYASVFYSHFAALGLDIRVEDATNHGRIDMTVLFEGQVWIFEFKVVELAPKGGALQQIRDRGYADKYRARGEPIHLVGVEFSRDSRNIVGFRFEQLSNDMTSLS
jgi:PD-(D/E)XK nuclease superfamily/Predicted AAA-ATPase